jgi:hypothetical protein
VDGCEVRNGGGGGECNPKPLSTIQFSNNFLSVINPIIKEFIAFLPPKRPKSYLPLPKLYLFFLF